MGHEEVPPGPVDPEEVGGHVQRGRRGLGGRTGIAHLLREVVEPVGDEPDEKGRAHLGQAPVGAAEAAQGTIQRWLDLGQQRRVDPSVDGVEPVEVDLLQRVGGRGGQLLAGVGHGGHRPGVLRHTRHEQRRPSPPGPQVRLGLLEAGRRLAQPLDGRTRVVGIGLVEPGHGVVDRPLDVGGRAEGGDRTHHAAAHGGEEPDRDRPGSGAAHPVGGRPGAGHEEGDERGGCEQRRGSGGRRPLQVPEAADGRGGRGRLQDPVPDPAERQREGQADAGRPGRLPGAAIAHDEAHGSDRGQPERPPEG